jgi:hypothetical protein
MELLKVNAKNMKKICLAHSQKPSHNTPGYLLNCLLMQEVLHMKKFCISGFVFFVMFFVMSGCGDDDDNNHDSSATSNIVFQCIPASGIAQHDVVDSMDVYAWAFALSLEETNGVGFHIKSLDRSISSVGGSDPLQVICFPLDICFELHDCYFPGNHEIYWETSLMMYFQSPENIPPDSIDLSLTLKGTDDNDHQFTVTAFYVGTVK